MLKRFTPQARSVAVLAQREARQLGHGAIGTEHVLLGILGEPDSAGARVLRELGVTLEGARGEVEGSSLDDPLGFEQEDAQALQTLGIDLDEVRRTVEAEFGPGALDRTAGRIRQRGHIPFTPSSKKALELALREAVHLGHKYIGTEHVLLALVRDERCSAARVLERRGVDRERVRGAVLREIGRGGDQPRRVD